jgi:DNA-binding response OmpR family regulator
MDLQNKIIVIVEDDILSVKYYETLFRNSDAIIRIFTNGKQFVDYFSNGNETPDLVIIDFLIPLVNGIDCVKLFRKHHRNTPVLMLTAYCSEQSKVEAYIAGCNEYVLKPVYPEKIYSLTEKYLFPEITVSRSYM